jgi:polyferredoxin
VSDIPSLIAAVLFIGLFLGLVIVMPFLTRKRFQCSAFCPFGAFQSLVDKASAWRVRIYTEKCVACMKCVKACPFMAIDTETITEKKGRPEMTCAKCGECIDVCPQGAISYQFAFVKKGCAKPEPANRAERLIQKLLDPQALFVFSAFTMSVIISSKFAPDAIDRICSLFSGGAR